MFSFAYNKSFPCTRNCLRTVAILTTATESGHHNRRCHLMKTNADLNNSKQTSTRLGLLTNSSPRLITIPLCGNSAPAAKKPSSLTSPSAYMEIASTRTSMKNRKTCTYISRHHLATPLELSRASSTAPYTEPNAYAPTQLTRSHSLLKQYGG